MNLTTPYALNSKPVTLDDYLENCIVSIGTEDGKRVIHYFGYGYYADGTYPDDQPYRFIEYTGFIVPLRDALQVGISAYERDNGEYYKQYALICNSAHCEYIYQHYDNGQMPQVLNESAINLDTPDGVYLVLAGR